METEQDKFMRMAYARTVAAARRAFRSSHNRKSEDAVQETITKMWDQWIRLVRRGGNPEPIIGGMIYHALMFVRYDRKVAGRARRPDVFDYRSPLKQQRLDARGVPVPLIVVTPTTAGSTGGWHPAMTPPKSWRLSKPPA